jgi:hypothetical protein
MARLKGAVLRTAAKLASDPNNSACGAQEKRGPRKLASLKQRAALIRFSLRSSAQPEGLGIGFGIGIGAALTPALSQMGEGANPLAMLCVLAFLSAIPRPYPLPNPIPPRPGWACDD